MTVASTGRQGEISWLAALASLKITLAALALLVVGVTTAYNRQGAGEATWPLVGPLALLTINLGAAVASNKTFRRQVPLLVFHLALLAVVLLIAIGRVTYLRGTTEIASGGSFTGLIHRDAGPWHGDGINGVEFDNLGFTIRYLPGRVRSETVNRVRWRDEHGVPREAEIGDQVPLTLRDYRFYTTHNKGFAPLFVWRPRVGEVQRGSVNLPAFPAYEYGQEQLWRVPGTDVDVWIMLVPGEKLLDVNRQDEFRAPEKHHLVVRIGERRQELRPGETMQLPTGELRYERLTTWMGYAVFYDKTMPWLLAACVLAVIALAWHFYYKYFSRPWLDTIHGN